VDARECKVGKSLSGVDVKTGGREGHLSTRKVRTK
jgi:hypothetical protein